LNEFTGYIPKIKFKYARAVRHSVGGKLESKIGSVHKELPIFDFVLIHWTCMGATFLLIKFFGTVISATMMATMPTFLTSPNNQALPSMPAPSISGRCRVGLQILHLVPLSTRSPRRNYLH
jgi:hypothetical protein